MTFANYVRQTPSMHRYVVRGTSELLRLDPGQPAPQDTGVPPCTCTGKMPDWDNGHVTCWDDREVAAHVSVLDTVSPLLAKPAQAGDPEAPEDAQLPSVALIARYQVTDFVDLMKGHEVTASKPRGPVTMAENGLKNETDFVWSASNKFGTPALLRRPLEHRKDIARLQLVIPPRFRDSACRQHTTLRDT